MSVAKRLGYGPLGQRIGPRMTSRGWRSEKSRFRMGDFLSWDRRELRDLERRLQSFDTREGKKAIRNAHKAAIDVLNEKARKKIAKAPFGPKGPRYKRGGGQVVGYTKTGREKKIKNFRDVVKAKSSWSFRSWFTSRGVVTRSWLSGKQYLSYLGPLWEGGFTPAKGTPWQGSRVRGLSWRYGVARREGERRAVEDRMIRAMRHQLLQGRALKPGELARVV